VVGDGAIVVVGGGADVDDWGGTGGLGAVDGGAGASADEVDLSSVGVRRSSFEMSLAVAL